MYYLNCCIVFQIIISIFNISIIYFAIHKKIYIDIDNYISEFENNIDYSNFSTDIKLICLYSDNFEKIKKIYNERNTFNMTISIDNENSSSKNSENKTFDNFESLKIQEFEEFLNHINLAKAHGIYGFAFYYYSFFHTKLENFLLKNKYIDFHFLLIWRIEDFTCKEKSENIKEIQVNISVKKFFNEYMKDPRYIHINHKPVLGIYKPNKIQNLKEVIDFLRLKAEKYGIEKLFILAFINENSINKFEKNDLFDGYYKFLSINDLNHHILNQKKTYIYTEILYKLASLKEENISLFQFKGNILDDNSENNETVIFDYYSPEQFYMINKIIIEWTKKKYKPNMRYIFINALNEWNKSLIFESDKKYGYASLNSLSKALFNLSYINSYSFINFNKSSKIAIQAHVYYENLIYEIVQKTNNIPVKFDLFISTDTKLKRDFINNYILNKSKANTIEIQIFDNKGRDVLPFLNQLQNQIKKYKYICHIHTKKSNHINFGEDWRNYLFNNLLGNDKIISEILTEFERNTYLGIIFPEIYYKVFIAYGKNILGANLKYMNSLISAVKPYLKISIKNLDFPMGNMFWAKVKAIYQIFKLSLNAQIPFENKQIDGTLMHGIERIWIYLVKINGFYYKKIFKNINL